MTGQAGWGKTAFLVGVSRGRALEVWREGREIMHILKWKCGFFCPVQASLVSALKVPDQPNVPPLVFFHFSAARPDQCLALNFLRRLCAFLRGELGERSALPSTYRYGS